MTSDTTGSGRDPVEQLAESFQARLRRGERPSLEEYAERCPERADDIRELFPALVEMEQFKPRSEAISGRPDQSSTPAESHPRLVADHPRRLGDYHILRVIGSGGMGMVYEAEHESLRNRVALKVMHPRFRTDASYVRRFQTEARSAARLHHTNIVPVFDYGEQDGICYYAMPLIAGVGLHQVLEDVRRLRAAEKGSETPDADGPSQEAAEPIAHTLRSVAGGLLTGRFAVDSVIPSGSDLPVTCPLNEGLADVAEGNRKVPGASPSGAESRVDSHSMAGQSDLVYHKEIARLASQVADALDFAHRQGVVHRDIKPSNLLLDARGNVWVTDFGLAKLVEGEDLSQSHDLVGTLRFMSPERFRGVTDRRGDIYALGATLYEMLTLQPAFAERDQVQLIDQITHLPPHPLRQHDRRIPRDLETIVLKALAKDPQDRFATAGELRDELRRFLESRPIKSRPVGPVEQFWRWCKRNPALAAANITAAVLTTLLAISSTIAAWTYREQLHRLDIEQGKTQANLTRARMAEQQDHLDLGKSYLAEGAALQRTGLIGQRFDSLDRLRKAARLLREHPDGRALLPKVRDQAITAMGLTDLRLIRSREIGPMMGVDWDLPHERYACTEFLAKGDVGGQAVVRSMADDRELFRIPRSGPSIWWASPGFSPDGRYVLVGYDLSGGGMLCDVWRLDRHARVFHRHCRQPIFHPDGRRLVYFTPENDLAIWDLSHGRETRRLPLGFAPYFRGLAPDGRQIAINAASGPRKVVILDLETGRTVATWTGNVGNGAVLSWSPDGRLLASGNDDGRIFVRDVDRGTLASVLKDQIGWGERGYFAPVGSLFVSWSLSRPAQFWDAPTGRLLVTAPSGWSVKFSADGRRLGVYDSSNLETWEIVHEQELITLNPGLIGNRTPMDGRGARIEAARYSPDGRLLVVATEEGSYLYDGRGGRELAKLDTGSGVGMTVLFDRDGRNLITYCDRGLFRWPIRDVPGGGPDALQIGPPTLLHETSSGARHMANWLPDGRTLAMNDEVLSRIFLVNTEAPHPARRHARSLVTPFQSRKISVAISPDGRWAAAGSWNEEGVYVWDLSRRRFERILPRGETPSDGSTLPAFSPDGRWLIINSTVGTASGYYFWEVGTWKRGPYIPRAMSAQWEEPVFSPDGAMIALSVDANRVRLYEMATGRTIAHLTTLQALDPAPLAFSPDGTRLIALTNRHTALIWDLRRIRERLRTIDLDWDQPPYPPEDSSPGAALPPIRSVRVLGAAPKPATRRAAELAACKARLRAHPDDIEALLDRGWLELKIARPAEAVPDLERGLRLRPDDPDALYLLASAQIATNNRQGAMSTLEKYLARAGDDADAWALKGELALRLGRLQEADADHGKVLDLDPGRGGVRLSRARVRIRLGRLEEALADLDVLVAKYPLAASFLELRNEVHTRLGHQEQARADLERAAESPEGGANTSNTLAWKLATGPAALRDPQWALELALKAVAAAPDTAIYLNTLGVAQYSAGRFAEAIATLEKSLAAGKGQSDAFDLFFLSMAHHKLGQADRARTDLDRALRWRREHPNLPGQWTKELNMFQAEAQAVLASPAGELPDDVFDGLKSPSVPAPP